jgi:hypothetical protein
MAFTTEWEWQTVDRRKDMSVSFSGVETFRENWTLVRTRISNDTFTSELGDTEGTSLTAKNGGVTETIAVPSGYNFITASGATLAGLDGKDWYSAGYVRNGAAVYVCMEPSVNDSSMSMVLYYENYTYGAPISATKYHHINQCSTAQALAGTFPGAAAAYTAGDYIASRGGILSTDPLQSGWNSHDYTASDVFTFGNSAQTLNFRCISDQQLYNQRFVDWYVQQQTWVVKSPWL